MSKKVPQQSSPVRAQRTLEKMRQKECKSQRRWGRPRKQSPLNQQDHCTLTEAAGTGSAGVCATWDPRAEPSRHTPPLLTQKLSPIDTHLQKDS